MKGRNEDTSAAGTYMSVVTLPSQMFKAWHNLRLEGTIGKWQEEQKVTAPKINAGLAVASAASFSLLQDNSSFIRGANTTMKMHGTIA